jgi:Tfp pilus assembly major pilin PilA
MKEAILNFIMAYIVKKGVALFTDDLTRLLNRIKSKIFKDAATKEDEKNATEYEKSIKNMSDTTNATADFLNSELPKPEEITSGKT